ncbi:M23 family metallopeptidase [Streptomyces catenulae]|uniref:M23 family metallopeptidase n=1 Tax=Streptomyces catenulae TaxID=66875 RepID=A0ABV2YXX5_9ACTN|nr:M23 family metallopeptidase [Streptomyces catenulae]
MASNRLAPEAPYPHDLPQDLPGSLTDTATFAPGAFAPEGPGPYGYADGEPGEWNPTEESVRSVRGRHRVGKQRSALARSGTVLGVGVIAAVGAGGMATAEDKPPVPISMPDIGALASDVTGALPDAESLPGIGPLLGSDDASHPATAAAPLSSAGLTAEDGQGTGAGEALRSRILQQADTQQEAGERDARDAAEHRALARAEQTATSDHKEAVADAKAERAEAARKAAAAKAEREAEARKKAEAARLAELAKSYLLPVTSYTLTAGFGQAGDRWAADHTGQDFAAPTGTPVKAVHSGTITQAGWAGAYGYRIVLTLDDGTELWFCHLSSMVKTGGKVSTGEVIGRVGATGNVTGPHLHLEVRPGGGGPIDPMPWLRARGLNV